MVRSNLPQESNSFYNLRTSIAIAISCFSISCSEAYPDSLNILQVDNGAFHKAKALVIPNNILLLFQPPYSPELNPIERLWQHLKKDLRWVLFKDLTQLQTKVDKLIADLNPETVASITGFSFILDALSVAGIF